MELSSFSENIVSIFHERSGETVELQINIDAFTPEFFRKISKKLQVKVKEFQATQRKGKKKENPLSLETEARSLELDREVYAELLTSGVLKDWSVTENGIPIAPTKDVLVRLPPRFVRELWELCLKQSSTVKKTVGSETEETSESLQGGSPGLRVVGQNT